MQHDINGGEKTVIEKSPAGDIATDQEDYKLNEERAKEEVQESEAEQMPPGTESSSEKQNGTGKVCYFRPPKYARTHNV